MANNLSNTWHCSVKQMCQYVTQKVGGNPRNILEVENTKTRIENIATAITVVGGLLGTLLLSPALLAITFTAFCFRQKMGATQLTFSQEEWDHLALTREEGVFLMQLRGHYCYRLVIGETPIWKNTLPLGPDGRLALPNMEEADVALDEDQESQPGWQQLLPWGRNDAFASE